MPKSEIKDQVFSALSKFEKNNGIYIFVSPPEKCKEVNREILNYLNIVKEFIGVYISINKSYDEITSELKEIKINTSNLFFINCVEKNKKVDANNCVHVNGPQSLTELSLIITQLTDTGKFDYVFFDSISSLLMYNKLTASERFSTYVINKLKGKKIGGVIISLNEPKSKKIIPVITPLCDHYVNIS